VPGADTRLIARPPDIALTKSDTPPRVQAITASARTTCSPVANAMSATPAAPRVTVRASNDVDVADRIFTASRRSLCSPPDDAVADVRPASLGSLERAMLDIFADGGYACSE
jgi:hypothetical protein